MGVAGVEADACGRAVSFQKGYEFGDLLEGAAEGELGAGGIFDKDLEGGSGPGEGVDGPGDVVCGEAEAFFAGESFPGAGMEDEVGGAEGKGAVDFVAEGSG